MQSYIFLDLDDTLFQTLRKCALGAEDPHLQVRACLPDGTPNSFATQKQQWLWDWLASGFKIIPVTARDFQAFERVNLPFQEEVVLNHGAVILDKQRQVDRVWMDKLLLELPAYYAQLCAVWADIDVYAKKHQGFNMRLVRDFDTIWYGVIKHQSAQEAPLQKLLELIIKPFPAFLDGTLYWHLNGNNLAILPNIINKEAAVSYLMTGFRRKHPEMLTFGAGDSYTDAAFMSLCDYALIPKNTQLFTTLALAKGVA